MAKFLIMTGPYAGHVTPSVPIARRLVERRHEVVWIAGRQYRTRVESTGAIFRPVPKEWDPDGVELHDFYPALKGMKGLAQMRHMLKYVHLDSCASDIESIDRALADFPADVFMGDPTAFGLIFKSEMAGAPSEKPSGKCCRTLYTAQTPDIYRRTSPSMMRRRARQSFSKPSLAGRDLGPQTSHEPVGGEQL